MFFWMMMVTKGEEVSMLCSEAQNILLLYLDSTKKKLVLSSLTGDNLEVLTRVQSM